MSIRTTPAILLRSHPYSETSWVLRFLTQDLGVVGVMAKGARRRQSQGSGGLDTFAEGNLTLYWRENRELQTLKEFDSVRLRQGLSADLVRLSGASVEAELVLRHGESEASPELYSHLSRDLDALETAHADRLAATILCGIWGLVEVLGYRPLLDHCVRCGNDLGAEEIGRFDFSSGGIRCAACGMDGSGPRLGPGARAEVEALLADTIPPRLSRPRAHLRLARDFITYHVSGSQELQSFSFLLEHFSADDA